MKKLTIEIEYENPRLLNAVIEEIVRRVKFESNDGKFERKKMNISYRVDDLDLPNPNRITRIENGVMYIKSNL